MCVTVLGASPWMPNPGGACSGYLVERGQRGVRIESGGRVLIYSADVD
jgi:hypothetical protein